MTADVNQDLHIPMRKLPLIPTVAIVAEGSWSDAALVSLIESFGYHAALVNLDVAESVPASVILVRSACRLEQLARRGVPAVCRVIGLGIGVNRPGGIAIAESPRAAADLADLLRRMFRGPAQPERVHLSRREREVVVTYTLGSTVRETSRVHCIAESTVRSHFRRVMARYGEAGRPVNNKSQLLIQLIADGWVDRRQLLH